MIAWTRVETIGRCLPPESGKFCTLFYKETLLTFADHGTTGPLLPRDSGDAPKTFVAHAKAGIDLSELAAQLQSDGAKGFVASWRALLGAIDAKSKVLA